MAPTAIIPNGLDLPYSEYPSLHLSSKPCFYASVFILLHTINLVEALKSRILSIPGATSGVGPIADITIRTTLSGVCQPNHLDSITTQIDEFQLGV
jgi:hypothetical protein